jgi:hypothetical protein
VDDVTEKTENWKVKARALNDPMGALNFQLAMLKLPPIVHGPNGSYVPYEVLPCLVSSVHLS